MILLQLFYEFFKIGLFAVGGGAATIPFLYSLSDATAWFSYTDLANMIAISESTPGAIGVNMSSYVGMTVAGIPGCIIATLGLVAPSIIVILVIAHFLKRFRDSRLVQDIFYGLRPASTGLIASACLGLAQISLLDVGALTSIYTLSNLFHWKEVVLALLIYMGIKKFNKHPIVYIGAEAAFGIIFQLAA